MGAETPDLQETKPSKAKFVVISGVHPLRFFATLGAARHYAKRCKGKVDGLAVIEKESRKSWPIP